MQETKEKVTPIEAKKEVQWCPLQEAMECDRNGCAWYITDSGKEECAIVKLAKGWQM